jgi:hypothetical protein
MLARSLPESEFLSFNLFNHEDLVGLRVRMIPPGGGNNGKNSGAAGRGE